MNLFFVFDLIFFLNISNNLLSFFIYKLCLCVTGVANYSKWGENVAKCGLEATTYKFILNCGRRLWTIPKLNACECLAFFVRT